MIIKNAPLDNIKMCFVLKTYATAQNHPKISETLKINYFFVILERKRNEMLCSCVKYVE